MRGARRFPQRLVRWTSLCVCLALVLTSLAMVPLAGGNNSIALAQGQSVSPNGKGRKVTPAPPETGAPAANLPNLNEVKRRRQREPEAPPDVPSIMRSRRRPIESRGGRKVGDPGTTGGRIGANERKDSKARDAEYSARSANDFPLRSSAKSSAASAFGSFSGSTFKQSKFHHGNKSTIGNRKSKMSAPVPLADDQFIQDFFYRSLGRYAYTDELTYWTDILRAAYPQGFNAMKYSGRELGMTLFESSSYAARNRSDHDYVYDLYWSYLRRQPDQGGWDYWTGLVPSVGRENVRHAFDECGEWYDVIGSVTPNGSATSAVSSLSTARVNPFNQTGNQLLARDCEWSVGLLSLPGRAGLDLGLGLSYSSLVWTRSGPPDHPYLYFNEDNSSPSPGFRLGFATIQPKYFDAQVGLKVYMLITSSGRRVELRQVGTSNVYEAGDSSYLQLINNGSSLLVRTTDGTQMTYQQFENEWYVTQIKDRNGNYLTVTYNSQSDLSTITDTLGRVIYFNYDGYANLTSISQNWNGTWHTWASFGWGSPLSMQTGSFTGATVVGTHDYEAIPVLRQVWLDDGSYHTFDYTAVGQVNMIRRYSYDNVQRSSTAYDYTQPTDDCPRISATHVTADNWTGINNVPSEVVTQYTLPGDGSHQMVAPDGTVYKEFYGSGWQNGLTTQSEVWVSGVRQKWTTAQWTQDNTGVNYQTNPRVTETNIYDAAGNRRRTTLDTRLTVCAAGCVSGRAQTRTCSIA